MPIKRLKTIGLLFSHNCNLNCVYCYVNSKHDGVMKVDVAKRVITEAFTQNSEDYDELKINIMGAEPLMYFLELKEIMDWLWSQAWGKPYQLHLTTNGSILGKAISDYLYANREKVTVCVSFDGYHGIQEKNRQQSIDLKFFIQTWPQEPVNMTVSEAGIPYLAQNVIRLHEMDIKVFVNCEKVITGWKDESFALYAKELNRLVEYYIKNPQIVPCNLFELDLPAVFYTHEKEKLYCGMGTTFYVYDFDGERRPCHRFSTLTLDNAQLSNVETCFANKEKRSECKKCFLDEACPLCYGANYEKNGNPFCRDANTCLQYSTLLKANLLLQGRRILGKKIHTLEDKRTLSAIKQIDESFKTKPYIF